MANLRQPALRAQTVTIAASSQRSRSDYNLFEGTQVTGSPEVVLVRGAIVVENGELKVEPGYGQFVRRARFGEELKPAAIPTVA